MKRAERKTFRRDYNSEINMNKRATFRKHTHTHTRERTEKNTRMQSVSIYNLNSVNARFNQPDIECLHLQRKKIT